MVDLLLLLFIFVTGSLALLLALRLVIYLAIDLYYAALRILGIVALFLAWVLETLCLPIVRRLCSPS